MAYRRRKKRPEARALMRATSLTVGLAPVLGGCFEVIGPGEVVGNPKGSWYDEGLQDGAADRGPGDGGAPDGARQDQGPGTCITDQDCPAGAYCARSPNTFEGVCQPGCREDADCDPGATCEGGACLGPDASLDGGGDAALDGDVDAGPDGGGADAGPDGGGADAGPDGGGADAGPDGGG